MAIVEGNPLPSLGHHLLLSKFSSVLLPATANGLFSVILSDFSTAFHASDNSLKFSAATVSVTSGSSHTSLTIASNRPS